MITTTAKVTGTDSLAHPDRSDMALEGLRLETESAGGLLARCLHSQAIEDEGGGSIIADSSKSKELTELSTSKSQLSRLDTLFRGVYLR